MIELDGVTKRFGLVEAVRRLSFRVPAGTVCGFLGPNGAGKSTTIRMIAGSIAPDEGRILVGGIDPAVDRVGAMTGLGWLPEHAPLPAELRVDEVLDLRARLHGLGRGERAESIERVISACRLESVRRRLCGQLSKGYRQRTGLAAALVHGPRVIVLDEPTSGLDPGQVDDFRALIRSLAGEATILLSTHVLAEVEALCRHVVVIDRGVLLAEGAIDELHLVAAATSSPGSSADRVRLEALYRGLMGGRLP